MPEVNTCFEQLLHGDVSQSTSSFGLHPMPKTNLLRIPIPVPVLKAREELNSSKTSCQHSAVSLQRKPKL
jgi:hypothetical protein